MGYLWKQKAKHWIQVRTNILAPFLGGIPLVVLFLLFVHTHPEPVGKKLTPKVVLAFIAQLLVKPCQSAEGRIRPFVGWGNISEFLAFCVNGFSRGR